MSEDVPDRYEKNPMLVIVENYVLDTIGLLTPAQAEQLNAIVCRTFGGTDWRQIVRQQFDLPADTTETITLLWRQRQEQALAEQRDLAPEEFAREIVDGMFHGLGS